MHPSILRLALIMLSICLLYTNIVANILNVPDDFETIQSAIDEAEDGDTVLVQPGEYVENIDFSGKEITVASQYLITGEEVYVIATVIDGDAEATVVSFQCWENEDSKLIGFTVQNGQSQRGGGINCIDSQPTISNCIIRRNNAEYGGGGIYCISSNPNIDNCTISENASYNGGGIFCFENSNPTLSNCIINENSLVGDSRGEGCGVLCRQDSNPDIINCVINGNFINGRQDADGGGISCNMESSPNILNCTIIENSVRGQGGGIFCNNESNPIIRGCTISSNEADTRGGGIYIGQYCHPTIHNCNIIGNSVEDGGGIYCAANTNPTIYYSAICENIAEYEGGGFYCYNASPDIINCTIIGNVSERRGGGGIYISTRSNITVINAILWSNMPHEICFNEVHEASLVTLNYSDIEGGREDIVTNDNGRVGWGEGNIDLDPLFIDPDNDDFHLTEDSPCIDAGTAFFVWDDDTLVDISEDEYAGDAPDMGAFEYGFVTVDPESVNPPFIFTIFQNYPNPFNSTTRFRFELPASRTASLTIFDTNGREVSTLTDGIYQAGRYDVTWNAGNLPSGMYLARLKTPVDTRTAKVMLIR